MYVDCELHAFCVCTIYMCTCVFMTQSGDSALMIAARFGKIDIVRDLAGGGAQLDLQNTV